MIKRLLIILLMIGVRLASAQTSVYHPFPENNAWWTFGVTQSCHANLWESGGSYSIVIDGDTLINSVQYHKLRMPLLVPGYYSQCGIMSDTNVYKGAFRQDISSRRVYGIMPGESVEKLWYDFNMEVGDSVKGIFSWLDKVISIDSVFVGDSYRKRWYINLSYDVYYIEGIGSTYGLVDVSPGYYPFLARRGFYCFASNDVACYADCACDSCPAISLPTPAPSSRISFKVYPNPSITGIFTIAIQNPKYAVSLEVYNRMGSRMVYEQLNHAGSFRFDVHASGVFIMVLTDIEGNRQVAKLISCLSDKSD